MENITRTANLMVNMYRVLLKSRPLPDLLDSFSCEIVDILTEFGLSVRQAIAIERSYRVNPDCSPALWFNRVAALCESYHTVPDYLINSGFYDDFYLKHCESEANDFTERFSELCSLFQISLTERELSLQKGIFFFLALNGGIIDQIKYSVNLAFTKHYRLEDPTYEIHFLGLHLFPRRLRVLLGQMRSQKVYLRYRNQQLLYTVFQGLKKGLLPVRPEKVLSTIYNHARTLSKVKETPEVCLDVVDRVCEALKYDAGKGTDFTLGHFVSKKSTIESNFNDLGSLGCLLEAYYGGKSISSLISRAIDCHIPRLHGCLRRGYDLELVYGFGPHISELWLDSGISAIRKNIFETPVSQPYCILEPMKVRTITKPKWNQYLGLKRFQKSLWRNLYHHSSRTFQLIGEPLQRFHLFDILQAYRPGYGFCSGDYSAATDNLHMDVSLRACKNLFGSCNSIEDYQSCLNALTGGKIIYPLSKVLPSGENGSIYELVHKYFKGRGKSSSWANISFGEKIDAIPNEIDQTNGQLMGSVLSFVLLCVANYSAYHYAWEQYLGKEIRPFDFSEMSPVKINGDDILFCSSEDFYWFWRSQIGNFGFEPSVGKNLFSSDILQINSELYEIEKYHIFETGKSLLVPRKINYANFGLITNRKKQDCEIDTTVQMTLVKDRIGPKELFETSLQGRMRVIKKIQDTILDGLSLDLRGLVNRLFWKHSIYLKGLFPNIDFFVPEDEGGIGLSDEGLGRQKLVRDRSFEKASHKTGKRVIDLLFKDLTPYECKKSREFLGDEFPHVTTIPQDFEVFRNYDIIRRKFKRSLIEPVLDRPKQEPVRDWLPTRTVFKLWADSTTVDSIMPLFEDL